MSEWLHGAALLGGLKQQLILKSVFLNQNIDMQLAFMHLNMGFIDLPLVLFCHLPGFLIILIIKSFKFLYFLKA